MPSLALLYGSCFVGVLMARCGCNEGECAKALVLRSNDEVVPD